MDNLRNLAGAFALVTSLTISAQSHVMEVNTKKLGAPIQSTMYGLFFEDINYAADGGLYGELVKNRSFEFPQALMGWQAFGCVDVMNDGPFERCPHYVILSEPGHNDRRTGLVNEGYFLCVWQDDRLSGGDLKTAWAYEYQLDVRFKGAYIEEPDFWISDK